MKFEIKAEITLHLEQTQIDAIVQAIANLEKRKYR